MIHDHFDQLETKVKNSQTIPEETRTELLTLLSGLKSEITELSQTHGEDARSIASFADLSTVEATRNSAKPQLVQAALRGLVSSIEGFESTHPRLTQIVNRLAVILSDTGI